tara:strand:+ start:327 stop:773 length:447 start_codon:yes stop_codon:yes gene_type:complete
MSLTAVNFKNDKSVIFNKSEIIQNQLIYIDESQSYFLDINQVGFFINPTVYGLFGKKKTTAVTINSNQVNLLNPITQSENHFVVDSEAFDLQDHIEDKIVENTLMQTEKKPKSVDKITMYLGIVLVIGSATVAALGLVVIIPYVSSKL